LFFFEKNTKINIQKKKLKLRHRIKMNTPPIRSYVVKLISWENTKIPDTKTIKCINCFQI